MWPLQALLSQGRCHRSGQEAKQALSAPCHVLNTPLFPRNCSRVCLQGKGARPAARGGFGCSGVSVGKAVGVQETQVSTILPWFPCIGLPPHSSAQACPEYTGHTPCGCYSLRGSSLSPEPSETPGILTLHPMMTVASTPREFPVPKHGWLYVDCYLHPSRQP